MIPLNAVHEQRIATAVRAALADRPVEFRVEEGDTAYITWVEVLEMRAHRRVIASGSLRQMRATLASVQEEFARQWQDAMSGKECGAVGV